MSLEFDPKKVNIPYTIAVLKPDITADDTLVQDIINKIEGEGFEIATMIKRELIKEEIVNLYYHLFEDSSFEKLERYLRNGECMILMLTCEKADPITKWREMIGPNDPAEAKKTSPKSLRALYGKDVIRNGFHGSTSSTLASKERDIFHFHIPQKEPEFRLNKFLIEFDKLLKFLYPPEIEHPNVAARLDLFAKYGPVVNCFNVEDLCKKCINIGREYLKNKQHKHLENEIARLGIKGSKIGNRDMFLCKTINSPNPSKISVAPLRILDEEALTVLGNSLCQNCRSRSENSVKLLAGRHQQHILTETEIKELTYEINKADLLDRLIAEKGSVAKIMIENMELIEPKEIQYGRDDVRQLMKTLDCDYYGRYKFHEMQNLILEDRRIRINTWAALIIGKPSLRFFNHKLLDKSVSPDLRKDPSSLHFTLTRSVPLSMMTKKANINAKSTMLPPSILDKPKLQPNEERIAMFKMLHRNSSQIVTVDDLKKDSYSSNIFLIRKNYHPGRHGNWNNHSTLKGMNRGSYVRTLKDEKPNKSEFEY